MAEVAPRATESEVRAALPRSWHAFFARFGRLTEIQARAAIPVARGDSVVLCAPTASGKTEAVVGPLAERICKRNQEADAGLRALVISPTRALCNDLVRRVSRPLSACGLEVDLKSGDDPSFDPSAPPDLLVTTPESLDSMICRVPRALRSVMAVVCDELHLLDGTARGDQLRVLLSRLDRIARDEVQRCAASASVPRPEELTRRYLVDGLTIVVPEDATVSERRERVFVMAHDLASTAELLAEQCRSRSLRKLLVFANRRADVEGLTASLRDRLGTSIPVIAHHGSIARAERLRAEQRLHASPRAVCVATSTLELGIDVGDIDSVALVGPPANVASMLQRVGRAGRRGHRTTVLCVYETEFERARFDHLLDCVRRRELHADAVPMRPGVIAQQAVSLVFQNPKRFVTAKALSQRLPATVAATYPQRALTSILDGLCSKDWLRPIQHDRYVAEPLAERKFKRGQLHSNLPDRPELELVDQMTGRTLGTIAMSSTKQAAYEKRGGEIRFGGRAREIVGIRDDRVVVRDGQDAEATEFLAREAPRYSAELARSFAEHLGQSAGTMYAGYAGDRWVLEHFLGSVWGALLRGLLSSRALGAKGGGQGAFFAALKPEARDALASGFGDSARLRDELRQVATARVAGLSKLLGESPMAQTVPTSLRAAWCVRASRVDALAECLASARIQWDQEIRS